MGGTRSWAQKLGPGLAAAQAGNGSQAASWSPAVQRAKQPTGSQAANWGQAAIRQTRDPDARRSPSAIRQLVQAGWSSCGLSSPDKSSVTFSVTFWPSRPWAARTGGKESVRQGGKGQRGSINQLPKLVKSATTIFAWLALRSQVRAPIQYHTSRATASPPKREPGVDRSARGPGTADGGFADRQDGTKWQFGEPVPPHVSITDA